VRYLLDTNALSEPAKPRPDVHVMQRFSDSWHEVCTAAPVWNELLYGCRRLAPSKRRRGLEQYLEEILAPSLSILPYDATAAAWHADERARLEKLGRTPAFVDGQIAAIAKVHDLILVTDNVADYQDFASLSIENWNQR
jgi:tRNA(fMet)-specific endonuclease VapC